MLEEKIAREAARRLFRKFHFQGDHLNNYELSSMLQSTYQILNLRIILFIQPSNHRIKILLCTNKSSTLTKTARSVLETWNPLPLLPSNNHPKTSLPIRTHIRSAEHIRKATFKITVNHIHPSIPKIRHSKKIFNHIHTRICTKAGTNTQAIIILSQD